MPLIEELRTAATQATDDAGVRELVVGYLAHEEDADDAVERLASALWRDRSQRDRLLIRGLIEHEIGVRRRTGGCGDALFALCFLLYRLGRPEDVFLIYEAKGTNMDCGTMIDGDLHTMRRKRTEMMTYVAHRLAEDPSLGDRYRNLERAILDAFDQPNYSAPEELDAFFEHYFAEWSQR